MHAAADGHQLLKILHVAVPGRAGGLERVVEALAVGHHRRGHEVTVATLRLGQEARLPPFVDLLRSAGVSVHVLRLTRLAYAREHCEIASLCRAIRPDVVHTHGPRTDIVDRWAAARVGIPTVTTVHGPSMMGGLKGAFYEWLQRRNYRLFDAVVAVSTQLRDAAIADGVPPERVHYVPNAWGGLYEALPRESARRALGIEDAAAVVGWVGRFIPVKGGDLFLDAVSRLPEPRPLAVMIGSGPEADTLRRQSERLGLGAIVRFHSDISDAGRYFAAFDTYVLTSRSEGLPIVLLEAMAARTPIVATRVGGIPDALSDADGWLVPPSDPAALAAAIADSLRDRGIGTARAERAADRLATEFAYDTWLERYEAVYRAARERCGASRVGH